MTTMQRCASSLSQAFQQARPRTARSGTRPCVLVKASSLKENASRRDALQLASSAAVGALLARVNPAAAAEKVVPKLSTSDLCDEQCFAALSGSEVVTTSSGLRYQDVVVGRGPNPPVGYQVVVHYVAMTPEGRAFDSSLSKGAPYDIRVGAGQVIPGLDEGLVSMKVGGIRRMYIPGELAFPKGVPAAAGRPRVPPASPVVFDVQLLYVPGLEDDDEY